MKLLYLDCQSGISGDMTLAALMDAGADLDYILKHLSTLPIDSFTMDVKQVDKRGISSKMLDLQLQEIDSHNHHDHDHDHDHDHHHHHRKASAILQMIEESSLPLRVKKRSKAVFEVIAEAEGKIHGMDPKDVHFHEVGAMDSIIDVIGVCLALESLAVDRIISSPVPTGYGKINIAHGLYPVPAPATAELLKGIPLADFHVEGELTTPTGAGFVRALADEYGHMPPLAIESIGYGAGKKNFSHPNVLRVLLFQQTETLPREKIAVLECQLDDFTGEALGFTMERVLAEGALDVYFTPVSMKKSRPGTLITVLVKPEKALEIEELLLRETSTFGVRKSEWSRRILSREFKNIDTSFGIMTVKLGKLEGQVIKIYPEYEDVKRAAEDNNCSFREVYLSVQQQAEKEEVML
ncbi:nickel pincer cofactor biosynthesis protein LarC [Jeotgalibacillus sp. S-D1]|uniref:nickel pincer cofactor biosynthesis protein LarC n=1 Tax=Jeotgalibacillus sp. S-D1 TaxID=2552189 RepID=UPI00105A2659|nr:nickel pincer cofactor biosynthesis protein LarC [Jeotgalibacillus sp. S-D1]TDL32641.1 nickel pincer cofactor biosynthesis protein LarC [Jeotgalibacillus sp. S-D1]